MKVKKIHAAILIMLLIFTIGLASAQDNATLQAPDSDELVITDNENNFNDSRYDLEVTVDSANPIYPWSEGDGGADINILITNPLPQYTPEGNTTIYYDGAVIYTARGIEDYMIPENTIWQKYTANRQYYVNVIYSGDEHFNPLNATRGFSVCAYTYEVHGGTLAVNLPCWVSGVLEVKMNGEIFQEPVFEHAYSDLYPFDTYVIELEGFENGTNEIEMNFKSSHNYFPSFSECFNISYYSNRCPIEVFVRDKDGYYFSGEDFSGEYFYGEDDRIIFALPSDIENSFSVSVDGKPCAYSKYHGDITDYDVPDSFIGYEIDASKLTIGTHNVSVSYPGDSKYNMCCENRTLNVASKIRYDGECFIALSLPDDAYGNLTVEIDSGGGYRLFDTVRLNAQKALIRLPCASYDVRAYYTGDDYDIDEVEFFDLVFPLADEINYGGSATVKIPNNANRKLVLFIGSGENRIAAAEYVNLTGNTVLITQDVIAGASNTNTAKSLLNKDFAEYGRYFLDLNPVIFIDNGNFTLHPVRVNFKSKITGACDITMQYADSKYISLKVYDIYGKPLAKGGKVKIAIGKKTFTSKTGKNGQVKFRIPDSITPGKYAVKITYKDAKVSKKLAVKRILSLKTVNVKKSARKLVLTASLAKVSGKVLKNKKVTFKFSGKKYTAKTNKKGVAKVTVKSAVLKKLKAGKKVTYQATYLKDTVKKTVKVKK